MYFHVKNISFRFYLKKICIGWDRFAAEKKRILTNLSPHEMEKIEEFLISDKL